MDKLHKAIQMEGRVYDKKNTTTTHERVVAMAVYFLWLM